MTIQVQSTKSLCRLLLLPPPPLHLVSTSPFSSPHMMIETIQLLCSPIRVVSIYYSLNPLRIKNFGASPAAEEKITRPRTHKTRKLAQSLIHFPTNIVVVIVVVDVWYLVSFNGMLLLYVRFYWRGGCIRFRGGATIDQCFELSSADKDIESCYTLSQPTEFLFLLSTPHTYIYTRKYNHHFSLFLYVSLLVLLPSFRSVCTKTKIKCQPTVFCYLSRRE